MIWMSCSHTIEFYFDARKTYHPGCHDMVDTFLCCGGFFIAREEMPFLTRRRGRHFPMSWLLHIAFVCNLLHHIFGVGSLDFIFRQIQKQQFQFSVFRRYLKQLVAAPFDLATTTQGSLFFFLPFYVLN